MDGVEGLITDLNGYVDGLETTMTNGTQKTLLLASNDINGGTPHRHLTIDANGRLLTNPHTATTNAHLVDIKDNHRKAHKTTGEWLATATSIATDAFTTSLDCSLFKSVRLMGKWSVDTGSGLDVFGSQTESGTYYKIEHMYQETTMESGSAVYYARVKIDHVPNFIKLYNATGSISTLELDYVGISN